MKKSIKIDVFMNWLIIVLLFCAGGLALAVNASISNHTAPLSVDIHAHVSFTTGLFLVITAGTMALHRPAQLYGAGALGAWVLVTIVCSLLSLEIPVARLLFPAEHSALVDYPSLGTQAGFLLFSMAILFKSGKVAIAVATIGTVGLFGHLIGQPLLYFKFGFIGGAMSTYTAVLIMTMSIWLFMNYFPALHFSNRIPSVSKMIQHLLEVKFT